MKWTNVGMAIAFATIGALNGFLVGNFWEAQHGRAVFYIIVTAIWVTGSGLWALANYYRGSIDANQRVLRSYR